ncbi:M15 family metallopeptidase [Jeotgalibacillus aurantiacus]|uniref:M15 family metallopeptidase n=1 Tax=Jeotgalibacillus aurantiacus TaxID=2763266 RepID=UPI001D0AD4E5|nr:M15 family metallopeptidase [Jeotgalibacillus aurantiacus]
MSRVALKTLIDRSVKNMGAVHPYVKDITIRMISQAYNEDINVQISSGYRSHAEQNRLYAQGRTEPGNIVTTVRGGQSVHNYGLAVDYFLTNEDGTQAIWTVNTQWRRVAAIGKSLGFSWGGDWKSFYDPPHLEYTKGLTWRDLQAGRRPSFPSIPTPPTKTWLESGDSGNEVKKLQKLLVEMGYKFIVDGIFGPATETALRDFQLRQRIAADAVYGVKTKALLEEAVENLKSAALKNEEEIYLKPTSPTLRQAVIDELKKANKEGILSDKWYKQAEKGELTQSDAIALKFIIDQRKN